MSKSYSITGYTNKFQYKELTPIQGTPTLESILLLFRQLKRNAQCIPTKLGGGQLGYLGLILDEAIYTNIPGATRFIRPTDPGIFQVSMPERSRTRSTSTSSTTSTPSITAVDIANQKSRHEERERQYYECQALEQALRNQIENAIDRKYLDALRNTDTDMINETIPNIMEYL